MSFKHTLKNAFKQNIVPGLVLQAFALSIALCYFFWPTSHSVFTFFAELKQQYTWRYALISTSIFGGLLPFIYLCASKQIIEKKRQLLTFYMVFWAIKGVEIDLFYQFQLFLFGSVSEPATIIKKALFDQLIYSPFWAIPSIVLSYLWRDSAFNFNIFWYEAKRKDLWLKYIPTVIFSNWLIWFPAALIIYTMPPDLQLVLFNLVLCFFVLLLATLNRSNTSTS